MCPKEKCGNLINFRKFSAEHFNRGFRYKTNLVIL